MLRSVILVLITLFGNFAYADERLKPVRVFSSGHLSLNYQMEVLKDESNQLTINQVIKQKYLKDFKRSSQEIINLSVTPHTYWVKFTLLYPVAYPNTEAVKMWYLELNKSLVDTAELYSPQLDGSFDISISDLSIPLMDRYLIHVNSIFPLEMRLGEETTFYVKIRNEASTLQVSLILWEPSAFVENIAQEEFLFGLFYGGIIVLLLYNFVLFLSVRDTSYLYYVGYLGFITLFQLLERGHGVLHIGPLFDVLGKESIVVFVWMALWCGVQFFRKYMKTKLEHPDLDFWLIIANNISLINIIFTLNRNDYITVSWISICAIVYLTFLFVSSIYIWRKGNEHAKFFVVAWTFNIFGFFIYALMVINILPSNQWTLNMPTIGIVLEALVLSFALAERIKHERRKQLYFDSKAMANLLQYQSVFDNSLKGMYEINEKGDIIQVNKSFVKMFGFSNASSALKNSRTLMLEMFGTLKLDKKSFGRSGVLKNQFYINKNKLFVNHRAKLIYDNLGHLTIEGSIVNMTEERLRKCAIEEKVRTFSEKEIAEKKSKQKSVFLSLMSRQIRTPLTVIIGFGEVLQDEKKDTKIRNDCIQVVIDNSRLLLQLVNDILDYSKIEAGKFDIEVIPVDVISIITTINDEFSGKANARGLTFHTRIKYPIPDRVMGDPIRILQVLKTLSEQGIRSTLKGGVTVTLSYDSDSFLFEVADTGPVISSNVLLKDGVLRLRLSVELAKLMGGQLTQQNNNAGKNFYFTSKAGLTTDSNWINKAPNTIRSDNQDTLPLHLTGEVLLAEDNIVNQKLIRKIIEKTGLTVRIAKDGVLACEYCDRSQPALVLMDINMPNRDGIAATTYLRSKQYKMPIYALTAETDPKEINKVLQAGCDGVLSKPIDKKKLYKILRECFSPKPVSISSVQRSGMEHKMNP